MLQIMVKHHFIGMALVFIGLTGACGSPLNGNAVLKRFAFEERHMGTLFRLVLYAPDEATAKKAAKAAFERIAELDGIMSDYRPASELMRLCKKAGEGPVEVSIDLFTVLQKAEEISKRSGGAFDVSIGPLVKLWRRARRTKIMPNAEDLKHALALVDYRRIRLDSERRTVQLLVMGMLLDLGGIAKGYAADAALEVLRRHGIRRALVAAGGDIAVSDAPPKAKGWKIGIAPLKNPKAAPTHYVLLKDGAISTSGDSEQYVEIDGKHYGHHVDPKTGLGLVGRRSVSIIAENGKLADGWAAAACVLGKERGLDMIEKMEGFAGLVVFETAQGVETTASKRFAKFEWREDN